MDPNWKQTHKINRYALGANVYDLCKQRGIRQKDLAGMVGVHENTMSAWLNGRQDPTAVNVYRIARILDVTVDILMRGTETEETVGDKEYMGDTVILRKSELMHAMFGIVPDQTCKDCKHLHKYRYNTRRCRKCDVYGNTRSEATDWADRYCACGLFNEDYDGDVPIVKLVRPYKNDTQVAGQMSFGNMEGEQPKNEIQS